jgi:hypothetical protein
MSPSLFAGRTAGTGGSVSFEEVGAVDVEGACCRDLQCSDGIHGLGWQNAMVSMQLDLKRKARPARPSVLRRHSWHVRM